MRTSPSQALWAAVTRGPGAGRRRAPRRALLAVAFLATAVAAGCSSPPGSPGGGGNPSPTASRPSAAIPVTTPATTPASHPTGPAAITPPEAERTGSAVPAGFAATSITFVSAGEAFVLGTAHGHGAVILRTLDRGTTWQRIPAPTVPIGRPGQVNGGSTSPQVWGIRFATPVHGFVFGNGLWETTDGGAHWARAARPGDTIFSLATIDGQVLADTGSTGPQSAGANDSTAVNTLARRALGGGPWHQVAVTRPPSYLDPTDNIGTQAGVATIVDGTSVIVTTDGGRTIGRHPTPCARPGIASAALVTPAGRSRLALVCVGQGYMGHMDKSTYVSADLGAHWTKAGTPPSAGAPFAITGTPDTMMLATASAASWLVRSGDNAATWSTVGTSDDGGAGWADLGFTNNLAGVVIHGPAFSDGNPENRPGELLLTANGGATWYQARF